MNELLKKIYLDILMYEKDTVETNRQVEEELLSLTKPYQKRFTEREMEELEDTLASMAQTAELAGFENGVRFTLQLLHSVFKTSK